MTLDCRPTDSFLVRSERGETERSMQETVQVAHWQRLANGRLQRNGNVVGIWDHNFRRRLDCWRRVPSLAHHSRYVIFNAFQKRPELSIPTLDPLEIGFPLPRHGWTLHLRVDHLDQPNTFVRGFEGLALPHDVIALEWNFDH